MKCPDECQVCQVYCFKKNSQIINLMSKISEYCERFSDKTPQDHPKPIRKVVHPNHSILSVLPILKIV